MDVLLVKPPRDANMAAKISPPLSLAYLAGALRECFAVEILDLQFYRFHAAGMESARWPSVLSERVAAGKPFLVGLTCLFSGDMEKVLALASAVKAAGPRTRIAVGGVHPTIFSREVLLNCPDIDFVVKGEGEECLAALAEGVRRGQSDFSALDGLAWRNSSGEIVEQAKSRYIGSLDSLPRPAYSLLPMDEYPNPGSLPNPKRKPIKTNFPIITSRSCGRKCNFCSLHHAMGRKARLRSAANVLDEMEYLYHEHGQDYFDVEDDNFTISKSRTMEICAGILNRGLDIQFRLRNGVHVATIDAEVADALASAGLVLVNLAIESGSEHIRNHVMGKNAPTEKIRSAASAFAAYEQILLGAFFIVGMPEETKESAADTIRLIRELPLDMFYFMPATPYPGTDLYDQCVRDGLFTDEMGDLKTLWRRPFRIGQTITENNPILIRPYDMEHSDLLDYCEQLEKLRIDKWRSSLIRKGGPALERVRARVAEMAAAGGDVYVFGSGSLGRLLLSYLDGKVHVAGALDNNQEFWGRFVEGVEVFPPQRLLQPDAGDSCVLVCILSRADAYDVRRQLAGLGVERTLVVADELDNYSS